MSVGAGCKVGVMLILFRQCKIDRSMGSCREVRLTNDPSPPKASPWQATYEFNVRCAAHRWFQLTLSVLHRSSCEQSERNVEPVWAA